MAVVVGRGKRALSSVPLLIALAGMGGAWFGLSQCSPQREMKKGVVDVHEEIED
jgi:hypothetical protein